MSLRIAIDMDDTLVDTHHYLLQRCRTDLGINLNDKIFEGVDFFDALPERYRKEVTLLIQQADFFRHIPSIENAVNVVEGLSKQHEIFIATAAMEFPSSFYAKYQWLQENMPFISPLNYVFCGDKSIIKADVLIDDSSRHFENFCGKGVLYTAAHNINNTRHQRVDSWLDVARLLY